jgi:hypothetical protein
MHATTLQRRKQVVSIVLLPAFASWLCALPTGCSVVLYFQSSWSLVAVDDGNGFLRSGVLFVLFHFQVEVVFGFRFECSSSRNRRRLIVLRRRFFVLLSVYLWLSKTTSRDWFSLIFSLSLNVLWSCLSISSEISPSIVTWSSGMHVRNESSRMHLYSSHRILCEGRSKAEQCNMLPFWLRVLCCLLG